jgi:5-(carboxyamino)imidazole ribonucleotide mutase
MMSKAIEVLEHFDVQHQVQVSRHTACPTRFRSPSRRANEACEPSSPAPARGSSRVASNTTVPSLVVRVASLHLGGQYSSYSIVQMPAGVPVATFAIGEAGATNAALFAVAMLAGDDEELSKALDAYRQQRHDVAAEATLPPQ